MKIKLLREGAKVPERATEGSAGYDLCACIENDITLKLAGGLELFNGGIHALVVALVALFLSAFLHDDLGRGGLEELVDFTGVGGGDGAAGIDHHAEDRHDIQEHFFECSVLGNLHYIFSFPAFSLELRREHGRAPRRPMR